MLTANRLRNVLDNWSRAPWESLARPVPWELGCGPRVWSRDQSVVVELDLPGRSLAEIEVTLDRNVLRIEAPAVSRKDGEGQTLHLNECKREPVSMQFRIPFRIDSEHANVIYDKGILRITLEKPEAEKPRKLPVRQG